MAHAQSASTAGTCQSTVSDALEKNGDGCVAHCWLVAPCKGKVYLTVDGHLDLSRTNLQARAGGARCDPLRASGPGCGTPSSSTS